MRARKVVTRSGRGIRGKFPSRKLNRSVHWESLLERDAILLFELHPLVAWYQEQPSEEIYYDAEGRARSCFPDFLLRLVHGGEVLVEIKRLIDLSRPSISEKLSLIALRFSELNRPYRILSEEQIRREPLRRNLLFLWEAVRAKHLDSSIQGVVHELSHHRTYTVRELAMKTNDEQIVFALLAEGHLRANLERPINLDSLVWTPLNQEAGDGSFQL